MKTRLRRVSVSTARMLLAAALVAVLAPGNVQPVAAATRIDIVGPPGSGRFGERVTVLPQGNIVVTDPFYDAGVLEDVGAVHLYDGATGALISTLTGSTAGDRIGDGGVTVLSNGNYVVHSPGWDNGAAVDAGAVTWGSGTTGASGPVSAANSLVGGTAGDRVGGQVTPLSNGNYLVGSPDWDNGADDDAGAATWGSGTDGIRGLVSAANSLVGRTAGDGVGEVMVLSNGNYLARSPGWDNGAAANAGAVTWGSGTTGVRGMVSAANSLVGSAAHDSVGWELVPLSNGNYLVQSPYWDNGTIDDAGAVTWGNGTTGVRGPVSAANSLVGSTAWDQVGYADVMELSNGNYLVPSPAWDNGAAADAGAITWGSGTDGIRGAVSAANSLVGSTAHDSVGWLTELSNGNYVVCSSSWDNGAAVDAGAVTWGSGTAGVRGVISAANSLVGSTAGDRLGWWGVMVLGNGNYVVRSPYWDRGAVADAGAVTWGSGTTGISGVVSAANSLVGSTADDRIGYTTDLNNGNYLVESPYWDNGAAVDAGAVTWGSGTTGVSGPVSAANSLVGSTAGDFQGTWVTVLRNGNYLVGSPDWDNGTAADAGAVTWGSGTAGVRGVVSAENSLVGSTAGDGLGWMAVLDNGNYVAHSPRWDNGPIVDAGAVTWGNGTTGTSGVVSAENSMVGTTAGDKVGIWGVWLLRNGNYVVPSPFWDNGAAVDAGAVTWGSGTDGIRGAVSAANSLVGSTAGDQLGLLDVMALSNGNYLVPSPFWDNGAAVDAGAVTWGSGKAGVSGIVSAANSLVGSTAGDHVALHVMPLSNGNYLVQSPDWDNGAAVDAGAVTWGSGTDGIRGAVSAANSLVGSTAGDQVGAWGVWLLSNGNYTVQSPYWDNGAAADAGAVTWGSGTTGASGPVSAANSLVGSTAGDQVGWTVTLLNDVDYVAESPDWDNGAAVDAGAVTWGSGTTGVLGPIAMENSVCGITAGGGSSMIWVHQRAYFQLVVGRPADNTITLFRLLFENPVRLPVVLKHAP